MCHIKIYINQRKMAIGKYVQKNSYCQTLLYNFWPIWCNISNNFVAFWTKFVSFEIFLDKICIFWNNFGTFLSFWNLYHYHQLDKLRYFPEMSTLDIVVVSESSSQKRLKPLISNSSHLSASGLQFRQKDFATFNQNAITPAAKLISENFSLLPYLLPYY